LAAAVLTRLYLLLLPLLAMSRITLGADVIQHQVLAHGANELFWIGQVEQTPNFPASLHSTIYSRRLGQEKKWQLLARFPARVVSLASQGTLGAALLNDGSWELLYADSNPVTMGTLPEPARMVALAGGRDAWWAVGVVPGGIAALPPLPSSQPSSSTRPLVAARAAATRPQSQPAGSRLVLFTLSGNNWTAIAELPDEVSAAPSVSLAFVDEQPCVANLDWRGTLQVRHWESGRWVIDASLADLPHLAAFQMLGDPTLRRLWVEQQSGPDRLYTFSGPHNHKAIDLAPIPGSAPGDRALAIWAGKIRMIAQVNGDLLEQDFVTETGAADGARFGLGLPRTSIIGDLQSLPMIIVSVALMVAIIGSFRQRSIMKAAGSKLEDITLAPYGRRLAAGLIDAFPVIIAMLIGTLRHGFGPLMFGQNQTLLLTLLYWCAGLFYVIYTTAVESLSGRTLGKLLLGLRVVGLDGKPASTGALVTRNMLRVIEVGLFFVPALMILVFPLRQRAGDVAAGTLVVTDGTPAKQETGEETEQAKKPVEAAQDGS
jgi:uncharacterized RDD family membrane protein YckC